MSGRTLDTTTTQKLTGFRESVSIIFQGRIFVLDKLSL